MNVPEDLAFLLTEENGILENGSSYSTQRFLQVLLLWWFNDPSETAILTYSTL